MSRNLKYQMIGANREAPKTKLRGVGPRANYTDRLSDRRLLAKLWIQDVAWSAQRIPTVVNLGFLNRNRYFFLQVAPQLS
jgi:hypothetical protein